MHNTNGIRRTAAGLLLALLIGAALTAPAHAQINGEIERTSGNKMQGAISWKAAGKQYEVRAPGAAAVSIVPLNQVASVRVQAPAALKGAVDAVRGGQANPAALAALEKIVNDYLMLEHDLVAMRWLGDSWLRQGKGKEVAKLFDRVMENRQPGSLDGPTAQVYWMALLEAERDADLRRQLKSAIEEGPRSTAAVAQMLRGEMDMRRGEYRNALVEGFLRTIVLFASERAIQPEALFKAARCFEELGESQNAEKMRKKLMAEYPDSSYSKQIHSGG